MRRAGGQDLVTYAMDLDALEAQIEADAKQGRVLSPPALSCPDQSAVGLGDPIRVPQRRLLVAVRLVHFLHAVHSLLS